jgi:hypothetical protein
MGTDYVIVGRTGGARRHGNQISNTLTVVIVSLFSDLEPGVLEDVSYVLRGPRETVSQQRRAWTNVDSQDFDMLAQ